MEACKVCAFNCIGSLSLCWEPSGSTGCLLSRYVQGGHGVFGAPVFILPENIHKALGS